MSVYPNVTGKELIDLRKLAEQQKKQRALKIKIKFLQQTYDKKLAESLSPATKRLDEVKETTQKKGNVIKKSNSENKQEIVPVEIDSDNSESGNRKLSIRVLPNSAIFSDLMTKTLGRIISGFNSLKIKPSSSGATILGVPLKTLGGDRIQVNDNVYDLTLEAHKALSFTGYTGNTMKNEDDIFMMYNIKNDIGTTGYGDKKSKRKTFSTETLPKLFQELKKQNF